MVRRLPAGERVVDLRTLEIADVAGLLQTPLRSGQHRVAAQSVTGFGQGGVKEPVAVLAQGSDGLAGGLRARVGERRGGEPPFLGLRRRGLDQGRAGSIGFFQDARTPVGRGNPAERQEAAEQGNGAGHPDDQGELAAERQPGQPVGAGHDVAIPPGMVHGSGRAESIPRPAGSLCWPFLADDARGKSTSSLRAS